MNEGTCAALSKTKTCSNTHTCSTRCSQGRRQGGRQVRETCRQSDPQAPGRPVIILTHISPALTKYWSRSPLENRQQAQAFSNYQSRLLEFKETSSPVPETLRDTLHVQS
ncbi:hypothetical protein ElyMa_005853400 [Elysia marginata]|uniref:Uncharacterized protein n=1 Tax=Elysia marginata TaxID=1093978 RepID=A0AAV4FYR4_9GAST|nr:hypothetical protein ElyMa_005853400 [Elysia marginata]